MITDRNSIAFNLGTVEVQLHGIEKCSISEFLRITVYNRDT